MKRITSITLCLVLLASLCACDFLGGGTAGPDNTTAPERPGVMEPLQGGPMLYTFPGQTPYGTAEDMESGGDIPLYPLGLVNQNGNITAEPQYERCWYLYDSAGRVSGLIAMKEKAFTLFSLQGIGEALPITGTGIEAIPGGRFLIVSEAEPETYETRDGLFDLLQKKFEIEPQDGLQLVYHGGGMVFGHEYATKSMNARHVREFRYDCAANSIEELPNQHRFQEYLPETGWMSYPGRTDHEWVDGELNPLPQLTGYQLFGFQGGPYSQAHPTGSIYGKKGGWVDRQGNFAPLEFEVIEQRGNCWIARPDPQENYDHAVLIGPQLQALCETGEGQSIALLLPHTSWGDPLDVRGFLLLDAGGEPLRAFDADGNPFPAAADTQKFIGMQDENLYSVTNGVWTVTAERFVRHEAGTPAAWRRLICGDYVIYGAGSLAEGYYRIEEQLIALRWDGTLYPECPLLPYSAAGQLGWNAGEQGPEYFWAEAPEKRGYVNVRGEWLFVDETVYDAAE
ncbi:MAG: hypothetical protein FWH26_09205 [Oscillospiraceae bacterium]|nr:hypothetical protein [Oscillospiraceae bacterium]